MTERKRRYQRKPRESHKVVPEVYIQYDPNDMFGGCSCSGCMEAAAKRKAAKAAKENQDESA